MRITRYGLLTVTLAMSTMTAALADLGHDHPSNRRAAAANEVSITERDGYRYITSNGLPDHVTGEFPTRGNPNRISAQDHEYRVPLNPKANDEPTAMRGPFGVALNGVPFDPGTAEFWSRDGKRQFGPPRDGTPHWNYDALSGKINLGLDQSNAHVQPTGAYHYHGLPTGLLKLQLNGKKQTQMVLLGYAADGFPIYSTLAHKDADDADSLLEKMTSSYRLKEGKRPGGDNGPGGRYDGTFNQDWEYVEGAGDLDSCNGRTGVTPEYPDGTYYYVITETFPFIPRQFRGTPDRSFMRGPGGGGGRGEGGRGGEHRGGPPEDGGRGDHPHPPPHHRGDRPPPPRH